MRNVQRPAIGLETRPGHTSLMHQHGSTWQDEPQRSEGAGPIVWMWVYGRVYMIGDGPRVVGEIQSERQVVHIRVEMHSRPGLGTLHLRLPKISTCTGRVANLVPQLRVGLLRLACGPC